MDSFESAQGLRHEYRYKAWLIVLMSFVALLVGGTGVFAFAEISTKTHNLVPGSLFAILPIGLAAYFLLLGLRSRLVIQGSQIEVRGAFNEKSANLSEIEGYRTISSRNGSYKQLILKEGRGSITISNAFSADDAYRAFFQKIPDLDARDRDTILSEISQQQDLGATPEERLGALSRAKTIGISLMVVSILLGIAISFPTLGLGQSMIRLCIVLLALIPVVAAYLARSSPLLYSVFKNKKDPRAEVSFIPAIAGFAFIIHTSGAHFVVWQPLLVTMLVVGLAMIALYFSAINGGARGALALLFFAGLYAYGLTEVADTAFDNSPAVPYTTTIIGGHVSHGKSTTYYLRLAPWGPIGYPDDVSVSSRIYRNAHTGDTVCLALHDGSLKAPWFRVNPCDDGSQPVSYGPPDLPQ
jgi:hypothetical protein